MKFIVVSTDYSGLGFAVRLKDEGHKVILATDAPPEDYDTKEKKAIYDLVGDGMVDKESLSAVMKRREKLKDHYWIWDGNHHVEENELLRKEEFKVFSGGAYANSMEHDRNACFELTALYGLNPPPSFPFATRAEGVEFCKENSNTAYVYKPDEGPNYLTFVPESEDPADANLELRVHLASMSHNGSFVLQERKDGVETNVEVWFQDGVPLFAFMGLECKKRYVLDLGPMIGCAFDFVFKIPLDCPAVQLTVGKMFPAYENKKYTGFGDANFIAARDGIWFFEKCERFGYNAHPNLFWNLSLQGFGEVVASLVDKRFKPEFSGGFGACITMTTKENPEGGKAIQFPPKLRKDIYFMDAYKKDDMYLTAGYDQDGYVLLVNGYGYTMPTAWENAAAKAAQIKFPYRHYRPDGDGVGYASSPTRRYEALKAMGYI